MPVSIPKITHQLRFVQNMVSNLLDYIKIGRFFCVTIAIPLIYRIFNLLIKWIHQEVLKLRLSKTIKVATKLLDDKGPLYIDYDILIDNQKPRLIYLQIVKSDREKPLQMEIEFKNL